MANKFYIKLKSYFKNQNSACLLEIDQSYLDKLNMFQIQLILD